MNYNDNQKQMICRCIDIMQRKSSGLWQQMASKMFTSNNWTDMDQFIRDAHWQTKSAAYRANEVFSEELVTMMDEYITQFPKQ